VVAVKHRLAWIGAWLVVGLILWLPLASVLLCLALKSVRHVSPITLPFAAFYYWRDYGDAPAVMRWMPLCAGAAALLALLPAVVCASLPMRSRRLRPARPGEAPPPPPRAASDVHGNADWLSIAETRKLFPGPHPAYGGVVVGEAYRVDQDRTVPRKQDGTGPVRFKPADPTTWGQGGKAPLLIDPCTEEATHGAVFAGSGGYKTTAVTIPTLATWTGSAVVLDPSCQVGPMTAALRAKMGHKVVMVGPGLDGFNVLDWIETADPLAETYVVEVIDRLVGDTPSDQSSGENAMFRERGKELLTCLLADLLWDSKLPPGRKTLREFRQRVRTPEKKMPGLLADIHEGSGSQLARELAGTLKDVFHETFSGIYSNANAATKWLSIKPFADMVSGGSFRTDDLTGGKLTVFVQIPMTVLRATPEIARVAIGALLGAAYRKEGRFAGRVLFLLDEVNFLGRMKVIEDARDGGRKYGITLVGMWQDLGQLTTTWGKDGKSSWFNSCSWRLFAAVDDPGTAEEVSKTAGRYTMLVRTEGTSSGTQSGNSTGSRSRGRNEGFSEQPRELIKPDEVRTRMRADEAIIFRRSTPPIRCGRAIFFRRPELKARIEADRFRDAAE